MILLKFKVDTNGLLCLLDSRAMHSFVSPSEVSWFGWGTTKVAKHIKVQLAQITTTPTNKVVLGAILECGKAKFVESFMVCGLDGIEAILGNTFLDTWVQTTYNELMCSFYI